MTEQTVIIPAQSKKLKDAIIDLDVDAVREYVAVQYDSIKQRRIEVANSMVFFNDLPIIFFAAELVRKREGEKQKQALEIFELLLDNGFDQVYYRIAPFEWTTIKPANATDEAVAQTTFEKCCAAHIGWRFLSMTDVDMVNPSVLVNAERSMVLKVGPA